MPAIPSSTGVAGEIAITIPLPPLPPLSPPVATPIRGVPVRDLDTGGAGGVPRLHLPPVRLPHVVIRQAIVKVTGVTLVLSSYPAVVSASLVADSLLATEGLTAIGQSATISIDHAAPVVVASGAVNARGIQNPSDEDLLLWFLGILP